MRTKQTKKSELTREKILLAAEAEFAEGGYHGARVDAIAACAGVNKRMIYAHFGSKDGLYAEILLAVYSRLAKCERQFMTDDPDPVSAIRSIIKVSFRFLSENPNFIRMLMWENLNRGMAIPKEELIKLKLPTLIYMREQIEKGKAIGLFREDADEYHVILSMMNFCFSYFSNLHTMSAVLDKDLAGEENVSDRADFICNIILGYLKA